MADDKPIIVIKKKGGHGGHHGGAWKIAYADFVTAMMAFFMVMWLLNTAETKTKQAIASYFRKPGIFHAGSGTPLEMGASGILPDGAAPPKSDDVKNKKWEVRQRLKTLKEDIEEEKRAAEISQGKSKLKPKNKPDPHGVQLDEPVEESKDPPPQMEKRIEDKDGKMTSPYIETQTPEIDKKELTEAIRQIKKKILASEELKKVLGELQLTVNGSELDIEIMDTEKVSMFARGSAKISPEARDAFKKIADVFRPLPNTVEIVGHTDAKPFSRIQAGYSNWELSQARANEARKLLQENGFGTERITGVSGRADRELKDKKDPLAAANRRITLKMKFNVSKSINIGQDPTALSNLQNEPTFAGESPPAKDAHEQSVTSSKDEKSLTSEKKPTDDSYKAFKPKTVIKAEERQKKVIQLPDIGGPNIEIVQPSENQPQGDSASTGGTTQNSKQEAPIGDSPVFTPDDVFSDF